MVPRREVNHERILHDTRSEFAAHDCIFDGHGDCRVLAIEIHQLPIAALASL